MLNTFKILTICMALALPCATYAENGDKIIANIIADNASETKVLLVEKSSKKLFKILVKDNKYEIISEHAIVTGINEGNKYISGDGKTPEGIYYITGYRSADNLIRQYGDYGKIYGDGALPLNYPNIFDKIAKKTGGGIWVHGREPRIDKSSTLGCVALLNEDFNDILRHVGVKDAVIITENLAYTTTEEYAAKRTELMGAFDGFITAWRDSKPIEFKEYLHDNFKSAGSPTARLYFATKKTLMDIYPKRVILNDDIKIYFSDDSSFIVDTDQFYCAPNLTTFGNKRYYFKKDDTGAMKLISEEMSSGNPNIIIDKEIKNFISAWGDSWKSQDIENYIEYYDNRFKSGNMNKTGWHGYKARIFAKAEPITLEIANLKWTRTDSGYVVTFEQRYSSGAYSDLGEKTVIISGCPTEFKIISETWKAK